jgi:hypothetical protein
LKRKVLDTLSLDRLEVGKSLLKFFEPTFTVVQSRSPKTAEHKTFAWHALAHVGIPLSSEPLGSPFSTQPEVAIALAAGTDKNTFRQFPRDDEINERRGQHADARHAYDPDRIILKAMHAARVFASKDDDALWSG